MKDLLNVLNKKVVFLILGLLDNVDNFETVARIVARTVHAIATIS